MHFRSTTLTQESEALYLLALNTLLIETLKLAGDGGIADLTVTRPSLNDVADLLINNEGSVEIKI